MLVLIRPILDFVQKPNKKYSYAASIGGAEVPKEFVPEYGKLLNDFDCITLREKTGASFVKSITDQQASVVLDPTLLLDECDWRKELIEPVVGKRPFVLIYMIAECKELLALAKRLGKRKKTLRLSILVIEFTSLLALHQNAMLAQKNF